MELRKPEDIIGRVKNYKKAQAWNLIYVASLIVTVVVACISSHYDEASTGA